MKMEGQNVKAAAFFSVKEICFIAVFAAVIAVVSQISIPMPLGVPMTLQTLIIPIAGIVLGTKCGTAAVTVYILIGAVGMPVFAGFKGGVGALFGMTGGFIISFIFMALAAGIGFQKGKKITLWAGLVIGAVINYAFGTVWFSIVTGATLVDGFTACVLPFIPTAVIKIILAGILGPALRKALVRAGVL